MFMDPPGAQVRSVETADWLLLVASVQKTMHSHSFERLHAAVRIILDP